MPGVLGWLGSRIESAISNKDQPVNRLIFRKLSPICARIPSPTTISDLIPQSEKDSLMTFSRTIGYCEGMFDWTIRTSKQSAAPSDSIDGWALLEAQLRAAGETSIRQKTAYPEPYFSEMQRVFKIVSASFKEISNGSPQALASGMNQICMNTARKTNDLFNSVFPNGVP
jgi:hypothetical protein